MSNSVLLSEIVVIVLIGTVANSLFKIGTDGFGELSFKSFFTKEFVFKVLTTKYGWIIFVSLLINLIGRILLMSPFSKAKYGVIWSLATPLGLAFAIIVGYVIFHETYSTKELAGMALMIFATWLISG